MCRFRLQGVWHHPQGYHRSWAIHESNCAVTDGEPCSVNRFVIDEHVRVYVDAAVLVFCNHCYVHRNTVEYIHACCTVAHQVMTTSTVLQCRLAPNLSLSSCFSSGSCCWLMGATVLRLPVSATHSIVGATVGFALAVNGLRGINWGKLGLISKSRVSCN